MRRTRSHAMIGLVALLMALPVMTGCAKEQMPSVSKKSSTAESSAPGTDNATESTAATTQPANPRVVMKTNLGSIVIELDADKAPITVKNFLQYVDDGFYNGTIFHRVIPTFMIQGGGFTADKQQKLTRAEIQNEAKNGLKNKRGTIAMARRGEPHSATSQFYINVVDNASLDYPGRDGWGYCVFGHVVAGMDVVDAIRVTPTTTVRARVVADSTEKEPQYVTQMMPNCPKKDVIIESVRRQ